MSATHTPLRLVFDLHNTWRDGGRTYAYIRTPGDIVPVAAVVLGVEGMPETGRDIGNLLVSSALSYDKHCGPRAIEAAEGDLLGEALAALEDVRRCNRKSITGAEARAAWAKVNAVLARAEGRS